MSRICLSAFPARNGWRKMVGGRVFYFLPPMTKAEAEKEAEAISARWRYLRMLGHQSWPAGEPNRLAIQVGLGILPSDLSQGQPLATPSSLPTVSAPKGLSLDHALRLYLSDLEARASRREVSERHLKDSKQRCKVLAEKVGADTRLSALDLNRLATITASLRAGGLSVAYSNNLLGQLKAVLWYMATQPKAQYAPPVGYEAALRVSVTAPRNDDERKAAEADAFSLKTLQTFSPAQFQSLLKACDTDDCKLFVLLGLNAGRTPVDLAELRWRHIEGKTLKVLRVKTGEPAQYILWPEVIKLLAKKEKASPDSTVFSGANGKPTNANAIGQRINHIRSLMVGDIPPHKALRATGANWLEQQYGSDMAATYLANGRTKLERAYVERRWAKLAEATAAMRKMFLSA